MREKMFCIIFIAIVFLTVNLPTVLAAESASGFVFNARRASIDHMLSGNTGKRVAVVLHSGVKLEGRIVDMKGNLLYLSDERMKGRTDNHVLIRINSIDALIFDATEFR